MSRAGMKLKPEMQSKLDLIALPIAAVLFIWLLYSYSSGLQGPFVFGDEAEYGDMIHSILSGGRLAGYHQYGPLYPMLVAAGRQIFPAESVFQLAQALNFCFSFLALFPFWLLARSLLGHGKLLWLATAAFILAPFWSFSIVTWADPLFYALLYFSFYLAHRAVTGARRNAFFGLGLTIGLLFLAKPIGLFYLISLLAGLVLVFGRRTLKAREMSQLALTVLGSLIFIAPWIYRNIVIEHISALGYSYVGEDLHNMLAVMSWQKFVLQLLAAVGFQLSYIIASALGVTLVIPYVALKSWRSLPVSDRILILYTIFSLAAVGLISAVHMLVAPTLGYWVPNGRYLTQYVPIQFLLFLYLWKKSRPDADAEHVAVKLALCVAAAFVIYACSPLESMAAFSIINNPDLAGYSRFFDGPNINWRARFEPDLLQRLAPVAVMLVGAGSALFFSKRRVICLSAILLGTVYFIGTTWHQHDLIKSMSNTQRPVNLFLKGQSLPNTAGGLCMEEGIYFDEFLKDRNFSFIRDYWCPLRPTQYLKLEQVCSASPENGGPQAAPALFVTSRDNPAVTRLPIAYATDDYVALKVACGEGK